VGNSELGNLKIMGLHVNGNNIINNTIIGYLSGSPIPKIFSLLIDETMTQQL